MTATASETASLRDVPTSARRAIGDAFLPFAPESLAQAGLQTADVEQLVLKQLRQGGAATGRALAAELALPFGLLEPVLQTLKLQHQIVLTGANAIGDHRYELTEAGAERARQALRNNAYCGAAPVPLEHYVASVDAQSVRRQAPTLDDLRRAFADLVINDAFLGRLGEAIYSGLGFMLYGSAGNGKTSIAQRVTGVYGDAIWIPRAISVSGEVMRLFEPTLHEELPLDESAAEEFDRRWVRVRRPTVVVGGELTLEHFTVTTNPQTGMIEAPLQLKSNCGTLVIDDLGRQQVDVEDLLNRWVTPLEQRIDQLMLSSGRKFQVPFDQLVVFSTNLAPRDLADEAFLRRIPYKLEVADPTLPEFRQVLEHTAASLGVVCPGAAVDHLLDNHYRAAGRSVRFCHARDLLQQVDTACRFRQEPSRATPELFDQAVQNYFAV